jgi:hypothetical protein
LFIDGGEVMWSFLCYFFFRFVVFLWAGTFLKEVIVIGGVRVKFVAIGVFNIVRLVFVMRVGLFGIEL